MNEPEENVAPLAWNSVDPKRVLRMLGSILGFLALVWLFVSLIDVAGNLLRPYEIAREIGEGEPRLYLIPRPLQKHRQAVLAGARLDQYGFSFRVPWKEGQPPRRLGERATTASFENEVSVLIENPSSVMDDAKIFRLGTDQQQKAMAHLFGVPERISNYELLSAALNTAPQEAKWWRLPRKNTRVGYLLTLKLRSTLTQFNAIYPVESPRVRGFQFGDPAISPYSVALRLFDENDRQYKLTFMAHGGSKPFVTQAEINAIVASVR